MTVQTIRMIGDPVLRQVAQPVDPAEIATAEVQSLIDDLVETMRAANGAGLAAPQIGVSRRIVVMEVTDNPRYPYKPRIPLTVAVNPELLPLDGETVEINDRLVARLQELRARGFRLALDDYLGDEDQYRDVLGLMDVVKVDVGELSEARLVEVTRALARWPARLLAEKVDTKEQVQRCRELGYELFQGYYFARPSVIARRRLSHTETAIMRLLGLVMADAAGRLYDGGARTALCWLDTDTARLSEFLRLPGGGDCSYPGLVWHDGILWVTYYSSHSDGTKVYIARVRLHGNTGDPKLPPGTKRP